jgi:hypothetical protein
MRRPSGHSWTERKTVRASSKPERNLTVAEQSFEPEEAHLKTADPLRPPNSVSVPPGVLSSNGAAVKIGTLLSLAALIGVTAWGALQVFRHPGQTSEGQENLPSEVDVARVLALCAAGDTAGARALARSLVRHHPTSPERTLLEDVCRGKRPD